MQVITNLINYNNKKKKLNVSKSLNSEWHIKPDQMVYIYIYIYINKWYILMQERLVLLLSFYCCHFVIFRKRVISLRYISSYVAIVFGLFCLWPNWENTYSCFLVFRSRLSFQGQLPLHFWLIVIFFLRVNGICWKFVRRNLSLSEIYDYNQQMYTYIYIYTYTYTCRKRDLFL